VKVGGGAVYEVWLRNPVGRHVQRWEGSIKFKEKLRELIASWLHSETCWLYVCIIIYGIYWH